MGRMNLVKWAVLGVVGVLCVSALAWRSQAAVGEGDRLEDGAPGGQLAPLVTPVPVPGGPNFNSLSAMAFKPKEPDTQWAFRDSWLYNPGPAEATYVAPVSLPHGATVNKLVVFFWDNVPSSLDIQASLLRCSFWYSWCETMAEVSSSGSDTGSRWVEDSTIDLAVVNNQTYWYVSEVVLPSSPESWLFNLEAIRVDYGYDAELPMVLKGQ